MTYVNYLPRIFQSNNPDIFCAIHTQTHRHTKLPLKILILTNDSCFFCSGAERFNSLCNESLWRNLGRLKKRGPSKTLRTSNTPLVNTVTLLTSRADLSRVYRCIGMPCSSTSWVWLTLTANEKSVRNSSYLGSRRLYPVLHGFRLFWPRNCM